MNATIAWVATPGYLIAHDHDVEIVQGVDRRWQARTITGGDRIGPRRRTAAAAENQVEQWIAGRQGRSC